MDMKKFSKRLEKARKNRGDSVTTACAEIGISRPTWYYWQNGKASRIGAALLKAAERYIEGNG